VHGKSSDECQHHNFFGKPNYRILSLEPTLYDKKLFKKVHIDFAGPWAFQVQGDPISRKIEYKILILMMVDAC
jgi:adenine specific DNA methylase Mod